MDLKTIKAAIIKRSRDTTNLMAGQLVIYRDTTILHPNNQSQMLHSVMITNYLNTKLEVKKPYRLFTVSFIIPVLLFQSGFLLIRKVNFIFGVFDGKDMREDINNG